MLSVFHVFRYHITAPGCELAKKLVQAGPVDSIDSMGKSKPVKTDTKQTNRVKQNVPAVSDRLPPDHELPVAAAVVAGGVFSSSVVIPDDDGDWQKELGFEVPSPTPSRQSW